MSNFKNPTSQHQDLSTRTAFTSLQNALVGDEWTAASYQNGWTSFGGGTAPVGYYKDALGIVHLRGAAKAGSAVAIFTLPVGYRPEFNIIIGVEVNGPALGQLQITTAGLVQDDTGLSTFITLDGISFRATA